MLLVNKINILILVTPKNKKYENKQTNKQTNKPAKVYLFSNGIFINFY